MNVSLRSQMTAGVAALGAAVVAVAPITQPDLLPSAERVAAAIQLSAFSNPITAITETIFITTESILSQNYTFDFVAWPDSFYGVDPFDPEGSFEYAPEYFGLIPNLVNQFSAGPLSGLVNNLSGYGSAGIGSVIALVNGVANAGFNAPFAAVAAVQELIAGDPEAALQTLVEAIVAPLQFGVEYALAGVGYILDNIIENIQIVATTTLPFLVAGLVDSVVGSVSLIVESLVDTAASFVANLADLNIEGAWNAVVDGLLGENGTLGQIVGQTIGYGDAVELDPDLFVVTTPSIRSVLTSNFQFLGGQKWWGDGGIVNDPFFGPEAEAAAAVTAPAPVAAVAVSAPAVALESAPAVVEAAPEAAVEAPAPVSEPAATTEVADEAPAAVQEPSEASAPSVSEVKSRVGDDSAVSTGTSAETTSSTDAGTASDTGATALDTAGPTGATAGDSGSVNESSAPKKSSPRVSRKAAAAASSAG